MIHSMIEGYARAWYNGRTKASQALDEGSIPFARTKFEVCFMRADSLCPHQKIQPAFAGLFLSCK